MWHPRNKQCIWMSKEIFNSNKLKRWHHETRRIINRVFTDLVTTLIKSCGGMQCFYSRKDFRRIFISNNYLYNQFNCCFTNMHQRFTAQHWGTSSKKKKKKKKKKKLEMNWRAHQYWKLPTIFQDFFFVFCFLFFFTRGARNPTLQAQLFKGWITLSIL